VGFTAREQRVGLDIPRPNTEATAPTCADELVATLGTNVQVVLEHDRLPVQEEPPTRILAEQVEDAINRVDESPPETLKRPIPLAIPMRV
jgi:hypothetical protein